MKQQHILDFFFNINEIDTPTKIIVDCTYSKNMNYTYKY